MTALPRMDDGQGAPLIWSQWSALPVGRVWPWVATAIGVLLVVMGAVLFSPDVTTAAIGASEPRCGRGAFVDESLADRISEPVTLPARV